MQGRSIVMCPPYYLHNGHHIGQYACHNKFDSKELSIQAAYLRVPASAKARLHEKDMQKLYREGLHAAMHAMLNVIPLHVMCGPGDMGAECDNPYSARFRPDRLLLFDKCPGGIGLSYKVNHHQMQGPLA